MSYELQNALASIKFIRNDKEFLLLKTAITDISVARDDIIKITTEGCDTSIFIHHGEIIDPAGTTISELISTLNTWIMGPNP